MLSIPVVHSTTGKPIFVLSMMHIMSYVMTSFPAEEFRDDIWMKLKKTLWETKPDIYNKPLSVLQGTCLLHRKTHNLAELNISFDPARTIDEDASLLDVVQLMVRTKSHRVLVVNSSGKMTNVITQSRLIQFIATMADSIPNADQTIEQVGIGLKNVVCILDTAPAYEAFKTMTEQVISFSLTH